MSATLTPQADGRKQKIAPHADWLLAILVVAPLVLMTGKLPGLATAELLGHFLSLADLPTEARKLVSTILFVPVGAMVVVLFHFTLGLKVLGLFRPILIAIAFSTIGVTLGVACLFVVLSAIALVRPLLKGAPYYARVPILLSLVAALLLAPLIVGNWWHLTWLEEVAYFPVIALCLTCESFAKVLDKHGVHEAAWQTAMTVVAAFAISAITSAPGFMDFMFRFPELLVLEAGGILLIARHLAFRLFASRNPLAIFSRVASDQSVPPRGFALEDQLPRK
jgi:7 transmembrane helices usually fused to an inactive transglutaminase